MIFQKLLFCGLITMQAALFGMQPPAAQALSEFNFKAGSVMPYTIDPQTGESLVLLGREAFHEWDKGTYDAFGGSRDYKHEQHPIQTAAREFAEESIYILGDKNKVIDYIDADNKNTTNVIVNEKKRGVMYITYFDSKMLNHMTNIFYLKRAQAQNPATREKDSLAWVSWTELSAAIANGRDASGKLKSVFVNGQVVDYHGNKITQKIRLRPIFVAMLYGYFKNEPYRPGKNPKIRFYNGESGKKKSHKPYNR